MPLLVLSSSPLAFNHISSSELSLCTSQLSSPQLPYKTIQQPPSQSNNDAICATSSLDLQDDLSAEFLAVLNNNIKTESKAESILRRKKQAAKTAAN